MKLSVSTGEPLRTFKRRRERLFFATVQPSAWVLMVLVEFMRLFTSYPKIVQRMIVEPG